ncbi:MAG: TetR/AcrR family transcriptional regulator [Candidatus Odinarchaeota archaeon]
MTNNYVKMPKTPHKKTRNRSPEKKAAQFEKILEAGKELVIKRGRHGFSMRALGRSLGMNQNNLYNYVASKRELYIAIRNKFFKQYRKENLEIIKKHKGSSFELLMNIFKHFLNFAENDFGAFSMMHLRTLPPSDKIGPIEKEYKEFRYLRGTTRIISNAIEEGAIKESNAEKLTFFIYSVILGAAIVERNMRVILREMNSQGDSVSENMDFRMAEFSSSDFRNYVLENLEFILRKKKIDKI